ncbi:MAG: AsmA family protein, partial [Candidatus Riflebacteria bacterium]|nr:AsmA family protein [Candidatus Riflebacteria bacterium]
MKKKIRKVFYSLAVILLALAGGLYYAWQYTYDLPASVIERIRDYTKTFHNIDFSAKGLKINLPQHKIKVSGLKIRLPGEKAFAELEEARIYLASGTGPLDLYYNRIAIERVEIDGLGLDVNAPRPASDPKDQAFPDIPASQILINGLKIDTSVTVLNLPDFRSSFVRADNAASVELSFANGPLGGSGRLAGMLDLAGGDANVRFNWQQKDFSGFLPLIYLWHLYGLNVVSGSAEVSLNWQGNLFARIKNPKSDLARFFNKELDGHLLLKDCRLAWEKTQALINFTASRTASAPWNLSLNGDTGSGTIVLNAEYKGREDSLTDFVAKLSGQRVVFPEKILALSGITFTNTSVGQADFEGEFVGDIEKIHGAGWAAISNWKYQNKNLNKARVDWKLNDDLSLFVDGGLNTEIGNLQASASVFLGGERKSQGEVRGVLDRVDLQALHPFIESPVAGQCSGPFKVTFDLNAPEKTAYDLDMSMREGSFY